MKSTLAAAASVCVLCCAEIRGAPAADVPQEVREEKAVRGRVKEADDGVIIEGLEEVKWGGYTNRQNSVIGALTFSLQAMGEDVAYDYLMGVGGAAFRFQFSDGCPSAPHAMVGRNCLYPALRALGYPMRKVLLRPSGKPLPAAVETAKPLVVESLERGVPVLHDHWECSIITGCRKNGSEFLLRPWNTDFAAPKPGYVTMKEWPVDVILLGERTAHPGRRSVIAQSLRDAVEMAETEAYGTNRSGFRAFRDWIAELEDGDDHTWSGHAWTLGCYQTARESAANYLRLIAPELPAALRPHLSEAADIYDSIQKRLFAEDAPARAWHIPWGGKKATEFWTPTKRAEFARELREVVALERSAVGSLKKALAAFTDDPPALRRAFAVEVLCPGIGPLRDGTGPAECSLTGSLARVLAYRGESYDYVDLMGLSAAAFRVRFAVPSEDWLAGGRVHPGISADACVGPHLKALSRATGYTFEYDLWHDHGKGGQEKVVQRIRDEVSSARPVVALNMHGGSTWGVIAGFRNELLQRERAADEDGDWNGAGLLCRTLYDRPEATLQPAPKFPWNVYYVRKGRDAKPMPPAEALDTSLRLAVEVMSGESAGVRERTGWFWHYKREYAVGQAAYDAWIADLGDTAGIEALPAKAGVMHWQSHAFMFDQLRDARRAAAVYLRRIAPRLEEERGKAAERGAEIAEAMVKVMTDEWAAFPYCEGGYKHGAGWHVLPKDRHLRVDAEPAYAQSWSSDARRRACDVLAKLKGLDARLAEQVRLARPPVAE